MVERETKFKEANIANRRMKIFLKEFPEIIKDRFLYENVEDSILCLSPISTALNTLQGNSCDLASAVEAWKNLLENFWNHC